MRFPEGLSEAADVGSLLSSHQMVGCFVHLFVLLTCAAATELKSIAL